jgi:hypothetical protein
MAFDAPDDLAEIIELPVNDAPSFYQRNSGALPRAEAGLTDAHRRTRLPRPENTETTSIVDRLRSILGR